MNHYRYSQKIHKRGKRVRRVRRLMMAFFSMVIIGGAILLFDILREMFKSSSLSSVTSTAAVQSATINIFRTPYFQFQADRSWREVTLTDGGPDKFVYRSYNGLLVQHELIVEVNRDRPVVLDNTQITRVIPVEIGPDNVLKAVENISEHCKTMIDPALGREQQFVTYKSVTFACNPDGSSFVVVAGVINSGSVIRSISVDGSTRTYQITYRDSMANPTGRPLESIINTFQLFTR